MPDLGNAWHLPTISDPRERSGMRAGSPPAGEAPTRLRRLDGVVGVDPAPDAATSTAVVHLADGRLPAADRWPAQFAASVNGSYVLRGVEVALTGTSHQDSESGAPIKGSAST